MVLRAHIQEEQLQKYLWIKWVTPGGELRACRFPFRRVLTKNTSRPFDVLAHGPSFKIVKFLNYRTLAPNVKLVLFEPDNIEEVERAVKAFLKHEGGALRSWWIENG